MTEIRFDADKVKKSLENEILFLFITATDLETEVFVSNLKPLRGSNNLFQTQIKHHTYYVGRLGEYNIIQVQCNSMGAMDRDSSINTTTDAILEWSPDAVIMVGIAFGKDSNEQKIGDVLISQKVVNYESMKKTQKKDILRSSIPLSGKLLYDRFKNTREWTSNTGANTSYGLFLSGEKLVDNKKFRDYLFSNHEAIGGEMEGFGVYSSCSNNNINEWLFVKGICDWAFNKSTPTKTEDQRKAIESAVSLCKFILSKNSFADLSQTKKKRFYGTCVGYGSKANKCDQLSISQSEGFCFSCYSDEFQDSILKPYKTQFTSVSPIDKNIFLAELKLGVTIFKKAIVILIKHNEEIIEDELIIIKNKVTSLIHSPISIDIVTNCDAKKEILKTASESGINLITKNSLWRSLFDFTSYQNDLKKHVDSEQLGKHYIELCCKNQHGEMDITLQKYVDTFLKSDKPALLILGDYGSGKTSFSYKYALTLLDKYMSSPSSPLPILIKLRGYNKAVGIDEILTNYFVNILGVSNFSISAFKLLLQNIPVVFIFDGFDEVAKKIDISIKYEVFKEICKYTAKNIKIIVTCRPNYFQDDVEFKRIFNNSHYAYEPGEHTGIEFQKIRIAEIDIKQVKQYLLSFKDELMKAKTTADEMLEVIDNTHDLTDLVKRPFLLYMILRTLPRMISQLDKKANRINAAKLYAEYTDEWLNRESSKNKTLIRKVDKELFCKELAFELYKRNNTSLHFRDFPQAIRTHFKNLKLDEEIDYFSRDIQSCSFLNSDGSGEFKFIHRSFMEYFIADIIIKKLVALKKYQNKDEHIKILNETLSAKYLSMEIRLFINDMIEINRSEEISNEWIELIAENLESLSPTAKTNALSILIKTNASKFLKIAKSFKDFELSHITISDCTITNMSFQKTSFYKVQFRNVVFSACNFSGATFDACIMVNIVFENCKMKNVNWDNSSLQCKYEDCELTQNLFRHSKITKSIFQDVDLSGTKDYDCTFNENQYINIIGQPYTME